MTSPAHKLLLSSKTPAAGGAPVAITFVAGTTTGNDGSSYTFSGQSIGTADADRTVVVAVGSRKAGAATTITGVTVGGNAATQLVQQSNTVTNTCVVGLYAIDVASGTTADIVVTFGASMIRCGISVYRVLGISTTPHDTATSTSSPNLDTSIDVTADGGIIGVAFGGSTGPLFTWSGITQDYDESVGAEVSAFSSASDEFASASTVNVQAGPSAFVDAVAAFASW